MESDEQRVPQQRAAVLAIGSVRRTAVEAVTPQTETEQRYQRYRFLVDRANDVFGDPLIASRWLSMPNADLGGTVPLDYAQEKDYQAGELEALFTSIEHGIDF